MTYMPTTLALMNETITTAQTATTKPVVDNLSRAKNITIQGIFNYGAGGTSADVYVQTSFDGGNTWMDIANFHYTTASLNRLYSLNTATSTGTITTPTDGTLASNTSVSGFIGDKIRVKFTSVGTYTTGTTCQVYATVRE